MEIQVGFIVRRLLVGFDYDNDGRNNSYHHCQENDFTHTVSAALDLAMDYVLKDLAHNFAKLVEWTEHFDVIGGACWTDRI